MKNIYLTAYYVYNMTPRSSVVQSQNTVFSRQIHFRWYKDKTDCWVVTNANTPHGRVWGGVGTHTHPHTYTQIAF